MHEHPHPSRSLRVMTCWEIDAILAMNFEWLELRNALAATDCLVPRPEGCRLGEEDFIIALAHHECHESPLFASHLQRMLDRQHAWALRRVRGAPACAAHECLLGAALAREDVPGIVWAMVSDGRMLVVQAGVTLLRRSLFRGLSGVAVPVGA